MSPTIASMGFNRTWRTELRYGCHHFIGLQMKNLEVEARIKINGIKNLLQKPKSADMINIMCV